MFSFYRWYILRDLVNGEEYTYEDKYATDTYHLPWARIHVYMIGMLAGYILFVAKDRLKMTARVSDETCFQDFHFKLRLLYAKYK